MKRFVIDLYDYDYTEVQAEDNEEESGENEKVDMKITGEENATNENNENVIEIDTLFMYPFLFQIVLDLEKKGFSLIIFQKLIGKK